MPDIPEIDTSKNFSLKTCFKLPDNGNMTTIGARHLYPRGRWLSIIDVGQLGRVIN
jgi:hypothetical protein